MPASAPLVVAALCLAAAVAACHYDDWSLDEPDGADDASRPPRDGSSDGASGDARVSDAAEPPPVDAPAEADGPTTTWCGTQGHHSLCADFDEGLASKGWTTQLLSTSGTMTLDPTIVVSAPDALLTTLGPAGATTATALFEKTFGSKATTWAFAFDVWIDSIDEGTTGGDFGFARIWGGSGSRIPLHTNGSSVWVDEDIPTVDAGSFVMHTSSLPPPIGMWERVEIDVSFAGTTHTVNVLWGTGTVRNTVASFALSSSFENGNPEFDLGLVTFGKSTDGSATRYDDVIIDVAP
jgi:hypothetical protein